MEIDRSLIDAEHCLHFRLLFDLSIRLLSIIIAIIIALFPCSMQHTSMCYTASLVVFETIVTIYRMKYQPSIEFTVI